MQFGLSVPNIGDPAAIVDIAVAADANGWDGVFLWDHLHFLRDVAADVHDPWVLLGAMATRTTTVRLGTLVTPLARRRPWRWAKEIVTLDHLSGGRAIASVGLGEPSKDEFEMFGDSGDPRVRADQLDEGLEVAAALWSGKDITHHGDHYNVDARILPVPVQTPRPPVWVAGKWPNRRPIERARRWDGYVPVGPDGGPVTPDVVAEISAAVDPPSGFDLVATGFDDTDPAAYERAGATWLVLSRWPFGAFLAELLELARHAPA